MEKLSLFDIPAVVLMLAAVFGYINHRWLKFPQTIGLVVISLPDIEAKEAIIAVTYGVVIFSIVAQGLTFKKLVQMKMG